MKFFGSIILSIFCVCFLHSCKKSSGTTPAPTNNDTSQKYQCEIVCSDMNAFKNQDIPFDAYDSGAPAGTKFHWDFGDGTVSSIGSPVHSYSTIGTKSVTLTASNSGTAHISLTIFPTTNCPFIYHIGGTHLWTGAYANSASYPATSISDTFTIAVIDSASLTFMTQTYFCTGYNSVTNSYGFAQVPLAANWLVYYCANDSINYNPGVSADSAWIYMHSILH